MPAVIDKVRLPAFSICFFELKFCKNKILLAKEGSGEKKSIKTFLIIILNQKRKIAKEPSKIHRIKQ